MHLNPYIAPFSQETRDWLDWMWYLFRDENSMWLLLTNDIANWHRFCFIDESVVCPTDDAKYQMVNRLFDEYYKEKMK
jgi:hypothetical protein